MRLLLDTHVFLWVVSNDRKLPNSFRGAVQDPGNEVFLSTASGWEIVIKNGSGRMPLPAPPTDYLARMRRAHRVASLLIDDDVLPFLADLPPIHRDPFDRLLIAQALQHGLTLVTVDREIAAYEVTTLPIT